MTTVFIQKALQEANISIKQLEAIAFSEGPGSYTGLRIGISVAKALSYALDIPLLAIDTLEALADTAIRQYKNEKALYCAMIDARRQEVFTSYYNSDLKAVLRRESVIISNNFAQELTREYEEIILFGNGSPKTKDILLPAPYLKYLEVPHSAANLIPLAFQAYQEKQFASVAYAEPYYAKPPNITLPRLSS
jgi:tRNA threonylcarbamoyladenosine biosynthesis protein TsaB